MPWTAADFAIVLLSWVELALAESSQAGVGFQLTVFRTFRLLRMVKLARSLPGLQRVMRMINKSLEQIVYLVMFFVLILFIAALLGQELFHGRFAPTDGTQFNFNSFSWAVITIFVVLSGENWNEIMCAALAACMHALLGLLPHRCSTARSGACRPTRGTGAVPVAAHAACA